MIAGRVVARTMMTATLVKMTGSGRMGSVSALTKQSIVTPYTFSMVRQHYHAA